MNIITVSAIPDICPECNVVGKSAGEGLTDNVKNKNSICYDAVHAIEVLSTKSTLRDIDFSQINKRRMLEEISKEDRVFNLKKFTRDNGATICTADYPPTSFYSTFSKVNDLPATSSFTDNKIEAKSAGLNIAVTNAFRKDESDLCISNTMPTILSYHTSSDLTTAFTPTLSSLGTNNVGTDVRQTTGRSSFCITETSTACDASQLRSSNRISLINKTNRQAFLSIKDNVDKNTGKLFPNSLERAQIRSISEQEKKPVLITPYNSIESKSQAANLYDTESETKVTQPKKTPALTGYDGCQDSNFSSLINKTDSPAIDELEKVDVQLHLKNKESTSHPSGIQQLVGLDVKLEEDICMEKESLIENQSFFEAMTNDIGEEAIIMDKKSLIDFADEMKNLEFSFSVIQSVSSNQKINLVGNKNKTSSFLNGESFNDITPNKNPSRDANKKACNIAVNKKDKIRFPKYNFFNSHQKSKDINDRKNNICKVKTNNKVDAPISKNSILNNTKTKDFAMLLESIPEKNIFSNNAECSDVPSVLYEPSNTKKRIWSQEVQLDENFNEIKVSCDHNEACNSDLKNDIVHHKISKPNMIKKYILSLGDKFKK